MKSRLILVEINVFIASGRFLIQHLFEPDQIHVILKRYGIALDNILYYKFLTNFWTPCRSGFSISQGTKPKGGGWECQPIIRPKIFPGKLHENEEKMKRGGHVQKFTM